MNGTVTKNCVKILLLSIFYIQFGITLSTLNFNQSHYIVEEKDGQEVRILIHRSDDTQTEVFFSCQVIIIIIIIILAVNIYCG